jgi:hypothetical protein
MVKLTHWSDVPLFRWESGRPLDLPERIVALCEFRRTGGMAGVVMVEPDLDDLSEAEEDRLTNAGPSVAEIDWSGFDARAGLDVNGRPVRSHG